MRNELRDNNERLNEQIRKDTKKLIESSVSEANDIIDELKELLNKPDEQALFEARKLKKRLENMSAEYEENDINAEYDQNLNFIGGEIKVGDEVYVDTLDKVGKVTAVNNVIYAVVCILGAWLVIRGQGILGMGAFTVGGLSCVLSYAIQYTKPFNEITGVVTELQTATAAADRVFNLLETENQSSDEGFPDLENVKGNIEIDNVYFSYVIIQPEPTTNEASR